MKRIGIRLALAMRAGEWWEFKIVPILAIFYATSLLAGASILSLAPGLLLLLAALVPGAVYVSVLNDLTDRDEDARAGKANRIAGAPAWLAWVAIAPAVAAGLAIAWYWRGDPLLLGCYLAAWISFTLYSLPPFRLKVRGAAGLAADAAGAQLFPTLVAVLLAFRGVGVPVDPLWLLAAGVWAFAHGLRGILWHQLLDSGADEAAGVRTFVQRVPRARAVALGNYVVWPAELAALTLLLWKLGSAGPLIGLLLYALLARQRLRIFRLRPIVVEPQPRYLVLLQEYYTLFLPLSLLVEAALRRPADGVILIAHLILFPVALSTAVRDVWKLRRSGFLASARAR
ncbi:MAG TPA: UbiA family prenyltransferase [Allosphingosinicella sp.]